MRFTQSGLSLSIALAGFGIFASLSSAQVIGLSGDNFGYPVSNTDLLQTHLSAAIVNDLNNIRSEEGATVQSLAPLTNGSFGPADLSDPSQVVAIHDGTVITYTLDTIASPNGYSISEIDTFSGWRDMGRARQDYMVAYSLTSDPTTFIPIATITDPVYPTAPSDNAVYIHGSNGALADNVAAIQFSFPTTQNGYVGYREFDVLGTPSAAPEPASLSLLGFAALGLLARRRH